MTADITTIGLAVDTTGVKSATAALDSFTASGAKVETATDRIEAGLRGAGSASQALSAQFGALATAEGRATASARLLEGVRRSQQESIKRQYDAQQKFIGSLQNEADAIGKTRAELLAMRAAQLGVTDSAAPLIARLTAANTATSALGGAQKLTAYQSQQLGFQLNDLFVQVASGQSPFTALIQQGSQLSGTFGGIGGALRAVGSIFTATRVIAGGLVAAISAVGYAYLEGASQSRDFAKAVTLTGNAAGVTEGQFNALTRTIAASTQTTVGSTRDILQQLVASGRFSGETLTSAGNAAQTFAKATGQSASDVVKQFVSLSDGVSSGANALAKTYAFLSAAQLKYIKELEDQGKAQEALNIVFTALYEKQKGAAENLGFLERAWRSVTGALDGYKESLLGLGRVSTVDDQIAKVKEQLEAGLTSRSTNPQLAAKISQLRATLANLEAEKQTQEVKAKADSDETNRQKDRVQFNALIEGSMTRQQRLAKALGDANAKADAAGASPAERKAVLDSIREQFDPGIVAANASKSIADIQRQLATLTGAYSAAESILEATRQAGLVADGDYYNAKRAYILIDQQAQVAALQAENTTLQKSGQNNRLTTAERIANGSKIADNLAKIDALNVKAAASTAILGIQQDSASKAIARGYAEAEAAARSYLDTLRLQQSRELELMGAGNAARNREQGRNQIGDRYDQQRRDLENNRQLLELEGKFDTKARDKYTDELDRIQRFKGAALEEWETYYRARTELEGSWQVGASEAMANYLSETESVAKQSERLWSNAAKGMEDALVNFAMTGKLNFKSLANSIISDLIRIEAQRRTAQIFSAIFSAFTGGGGLSVNSTPGDFAGIAPPGVDIPTRGGRAIGGPVSSGGIYEINETGRPEIASFGGRDFLMTGNQSGTVKAADTGSSGPNIVFNIGAGVTRNELAALVPELKKQIKAEMQNTARRPGYAGA